MSSPANDRLQEQATELFRAGRLGESEAIANRIIGVRKNDADAMTLLGRIAMRRAQFDLAANWYGKAVGVARKRPSLHCELATANLARGRFPEALAAYEKALKLDPRQMDALAGKAEVLERSGKRDRAAALLERHMRAGTATPRMSVVYARALQGAGRHEDAIAIIRRQLARADHDGAARRSLLLQLGRSLDHLGEYDEAFAAFREGNAVGAPPFDIGVVERGVDTLIEAFNAETLAALPRPKHGSRLPIFVFGMPRSGTTLIEQIIDAHPLVHGAGEIHDLVHLRSLVPAVVGSGRAYPQCVRDLTQGHMDQLAASFLQRLRSYSTGAERIVDKSLENYECLGLIALLFPQAALIHARRHPLDVCFSCFMQDLSPQLQPASTDLRSMGLYYRQYERLMEHWKRTLDIPMLAVEYESLVADQETESRRIVEFLGLPWDERCLRFHESKRDVATASYDQVRRPIYATAVARYEHYEHHLGALRDALDSP